MESMEAPKCLECDLDCALTNGREVYPHRKDLAKTPVWICRRCNARVGCHPGSIRPLGFPANEALRKARALLHDRMLDPLWRDADDSLGPYQQRRLRVYRYLSETLKIPRDQTHTAMFDLDTCRRAWRALKGVTYQMIHDRREAQKKADAKKEPAA